MLEFEEQNEKYLDDFIEFANGKLNITKSNDNEGMKTYKVCALYGENDFDNMNQIILDSFLKSFSSDIQILASRIVVTPLIFDPPIDKKMKGVLMTYKIIN